MRHPEDYTYMPIRQHTNASTLCLNTCIHVCMIYIQLYDKVQRIATAYRQEAMCLQILQIMEAAEVPAALPPGQHPQVLHIVST